jgi:hypothetical protein
MLGQATGLNLMVSPGRLSSMPAQQKIWIVGQCLLKPILLTQLSEVSFFQSRAWIEALPEEVRQLHPGINMNYGWVLYTSRDYRPLPGLLDKIGQYAGDSNDILGEVSTGLLN